MPDPGRPKTPRHRAKRLAEGPLYQHMDEAYARWKGQPDWMQRLEMLVQEWNKEFGTRKDPRKELTTFLHARANADKR